MRLGMKQIGFVIALGCLTGCSPSGAQAQNVSPSSEASKIKSNWVVDQTASSLSFSSEMNGDAFSGSFGNFTADIRFDPENLSDARIHVSVDMASADAKDEERNDALPGKEWFSVKTFPNAVFTAETVNKTGENDFEAVGNLTIRDVTKPVTLQFNLIIDGNLAKANAQMSIDRSDFGVGSGMWKSEDWVVHNVDVSVVIMATATP